MSLPEISTRYVFFTGKGGVGKTSLSCATALSLAQNGKKTLVVSTDPASNLSDVLEVNVGNVPVEVPNAPGLFALNIDPRAAAHAYRERMIAPYRGVLPEAAIKSIEEQFSGACTVEIAAFDEFSKLLGDLNATADFAHVVFDTAPTGHTLRLLTLPTAWDNFISTSTTGTSCLGPLAGLAEQRALYAATMARLADSQETTLVLVARPDKAAIREAERTRLELEALGIKNLQMIINGVFTTDTNDDPIAVAMARRASEALETLSGLLGDLPRSVLPFFPLGTTGLAALRQMISEKPARPAAVFVDPKEKLALKALPKFVSLVDKLASKERGVIMTMGKGGVGKTTIAAALALALAERGKKVTLSTTDPAAHLTYALSGEYENIVIERIDPAKEVAKYRAEVLETTGKNLDAGALAMLEEDLRSPCTEEIAVFRAFARTVETAENGFVVLDTAPTGHTILLLDATEAYHREVMRTHGNLPESVKKLLPRLRDLEFSHVVIVTLPEATPVHEAEQLQEDLERAGIYPFVWAINQSLFASDTHHPVLLQRAEYETLFIKHVVEKSSKGRCVLIPWLAQEPVGKEGLGNFIHNS